MILIEEVLSLDAVFVSLKVHSRRHAFETMLASVFQGRTLVGDLAKERAQEQAQKQAQEQALELLVEREKLGSTAIGNGVALPHALIEGIDGALGCFARLTTPIDFDALDDEPVDLLFMLLVDRAHGAQHARTISHISLVMSQKSLQEAIRHAKDRNEILELLKSYEHATTHS